MKQTKKYNIKEIKKKKKRWKDEEDFMVFNMIRKIRR